MKRCYIVNKYGISTFEEMENAYKENKISEKNSYEDYFTLAHLEEEITELKKVLNNI
jgi:hypothetical protein